MKKLADLLKNEREKRGLSLQEIAQSLKINVKILKAIEENNIDKLPAKTFLRGFVRSYAQYLRLDVNEALNLFQEEFGPSKPEYMYRNIAPTTTAGSSSGSNEVKPEAKVEYKAPSLPRSESSAKKISSSEDYLTGNKALTILGSLFLVIMIVIIAKLIDKYQKEANTADISPSIEKTMPDVNTLSPEQTPSTDDSMVTVSPTPENNAIAETALPPKNIPLTTPAPSVSATPTPVPTVVATPTPTPTPSATAKPQPTPSPSPSETPLVSESPTPTVSVIPSPSPGKPNEVIIEALNKVSIRYSFDGSKFETLELAADQLHTFKSKKQIILEVNDGGSISLIVNGRDKGVPGTIGKPITLSYPK